jgi:CTP synthase
VASQFHPEFKSRPERPHPLFDGFIAAALGAPPEVKPAAAEAPHAGRAPKVATRS